jgi:DnaJ-class molecular chaperone
MTKKKATTDYYQVLGVDPDAELRTIRSAYRRLARRYHPDVARNKDAGRRFLVIQEAYEVLSDPERRREYDQLIAKPVLVSGRSGTRATVGGGGKASPESSALRRGFRFVVDALGIRVDAGVRFSGPSRDSRSRQRPSRPQGKQRRQK